MRFTVACVPDGYVKLGELTLSTSRIRLSLGLMPRSTAAPRAASFIVCEAPALILCAPRSVLIFEAFVLRPPFQTFLLLRLPMTKHSKYFTRILTKFHLI